MTHGPKSEPLRHIAAYPKGMRTVAKFAILLPPAALLAACAGPLNNESGIGNAGGRTVYAPATLAQSALLPVNAEFEPVADTKSAPVYGANGPTNADSAQPSVLAIDRDNWSTIAVIVPNNLPAHQPRYATNYVSNWSARARGEYPDDRTALNMGSDEGNRQQVVEAVAAPFVAASDIILYLPRAVMESRPYRPTRTGTWPYERAPRDQQLKPVPVTPLEQPDNAAKESSGAKGK